VRLFRRRNEEPEPEAPDVAEQSDVDVARQERPRTGDWMTMPPMATATKPMPTSFRVQTLPEILSSHQDTRLSSSLGHAVSADAPSGSIEGLASATGTVSATAGHGDLLLREPAHHEPGRAEPEPAPVQRRLATSEPAPAPAADVVAAHLPAPAVSRTLANPAPLVAAAAGERPLPVARVVDAPAASTAPPSPPSSPSASPVESAAPRGEGGAPLIGDDRVGGFEVDLDELATTAAYDPTPIRTSPPEELAPPIQSRRIQRRVDTSHPTGPRITSEPPATPASASAPATGAADPIAPTSAPLAPTTADATPSVAGPAAPRGEGVAGPAVSGPTEDLPLVARPAAGSGDDAAPLSVSRLADDAPSAPAAASSPGPSSVSRLADGAAAPSASTDPSGAAPASDGPVPSAGTAEHAADTPTAPLSSDAPLSSAGPFPSTAAEARSAPASGDLPLHAPSTGAAPAAPDLQAPIQRLAATPGPTGSSTTTSDAASRGAEATGSDGASVTDVTASPSAPAAGAPDTPGATESVSGPSAPGGTTSSDPPTIDDAPLLGAPPLVAASAELPVDGGGDGHTIPAALDGSELPLVEPSTSAPTIGARDPLVHVQTLTDSGIDGVHADRAESTPSLPLAPAEPGGALPPAGGVSAAATPADAAPSSPTVGLRPAMPASSAATGPPNAASSVQRRADPTAPATSQASASSPSGAERPLVRPLLGPGSLSPIGLQRQVSATSPTSSSPSTGAASAPATWSPAPSGGDLVLASSAPAATAPNATSVASGTAVLRRIDTAGADVGPGGVVTADTLSPIQRLGASGPSTASAGSTTAARGESLPLHTAAASIPSAAAIAVRAGLAERGPGGSLVPTTSFASHTSAGDSAGDSGGTDSSDPISIQRESSPAVRAANPRPAAAAPAGVPAATGGAAAPAGAASGSPAANAQDLVEEAKKLYPFIRSALEADLRRQLEGKSRSRFRP
jgi:hypothetical protein